MKIDAYGDYQGPIKRLLWTSRGAIANVLAPAQLERFRQIVLQMEGPCMIPADDGVLYLVDNGLVPRGTLPYHGPYVAKELIIAQMVNYGFDLVRQHQHIPQRYLLVLRKRLSVK